MLRLLLVSTAALVVVATPIPDLTLDEDWEMWKEYHGKKYDDKQSELERRMIWEENLNKINRHNLEYRMGMQTYTMDMNFYSDMVSLRLLTKCLILAGSAMFVVTFNLPTHVRLP